MNEYNFEILGNPKALKRHRTYQTKAGKYIQYDPSKSDKADLIVAILNKAPPEPLRGPISLDIKFYMKRPKSHYRTGKYSGVLKKSSPTLHCKKPDIDNLIKMIDAFNSIVWHDDSQVFKITAEKIYSWRPRTTIKVSERRENTSE